MSSPTPPPPLAQFLYNLSMEFPNGLVWTRY
jgi:hypothetical protein